MRALRRQIGQIEGGRRPREDAVVSSGCRALDRLLPERGFRRGTLVEWLSAGQAAGAETLALVTAREACGKGGVLVVFDRERQFYPPGAVRMGIDPGDLIVVRAANRADETWAMDQTLRCPGVAAVLAWPDDLKGHDFRRFQLLPKRVAGWDCWCVRKMSSTSPLGPTCDC